MRSGTLKIETVARLQMVMLLAVKGNVELSSQDVKKFLTFVRVGFAAAASRFDAEKMRLHRGVSPSKQFHAHIWSCFQDFSLVRANEPGIITGGFEEGKNVGAIEA